MKKLTYLKLPKTVKKYKQWTDDIANGTYRSYLTVRDVNKVGRRHWMFCDKQNREVHLLSDGERRMYMELLYKPSTVAVFEQYALDLDETLDIAVELNIMHPRNWKTYEAYVMSTDFLVESLSADDSTTQLTNSALGREPGWPGAGLCTDPALPQELSATSKATLCTAG